MNTPRPIYSSRRPSSPGTRHWPSGRNRSQTCSPPASRPFRQLLARKRRRTRSCVRICRKSPSRSAWPANRPGKYSRKSANAKIILDAVTSVRGALRQLAPFLSPHAHDQFVRAGFGLEHRGLGFAYVEPVLAEGIQNVRLMSDDHDVAAGGRLRRDEHAQRLRAPIVLNRSDDKASFGEVDRCRQGAKAHQRPRLDRSIEHAGVDLSDRNPKLAQRIADCARQRATLLVELALLGDILEVERIGVGLVL